MHEGLYTNSINEKNSVFILKNHYLALAKLMDFSNFALIKLKTEFKKSLNK
ncbi:hypothetical protein BROOK1789B_244 [Bathymodiolus brooksi thiotrophic gill symbiont]|nr:hypothetical protein BROOK1789B_244 [Bathymodiolus brooksi thiotrophic gill symbiont]